jgi:putative spermidine/putrescine transport system ATP-binding protein
LPYLDLANVTKLYRDVVAVDDLSLAVEEGEMLCLLGPSGCGKTTTLRIIAGFEAVSAGAISLGGRDLTHVPAEGRDIGLVFQNYALFPHMTAEENIAFGLKMRRQKAANVAAGVAEALRLVRLDGIGGRYPRQLSGGQQQRVALARAIAIRPRLLLLDEPLSNLDAKLRDIMREEIRGLQRQLGITAIFVTHDQIEALAMADRMAVMDRGRIIQVDTPARIYERPAHPFVAGFIGEANRWSGHVLGTDNGRLFAEVGDGLLRLHGIADEALPLGSPVMAVVKTERIRLSREPDRGEAFSMAAQIVSRTFLGSTVVYRCAMGEFQLTAALTNNPGAGFAIGEAVYASWQPSDCLMIPAPDDIESGSSSRIDNS